MPCGEVEYWLVRSAEEGRAGIGEFVRVCGGVYVDVFLSGTEFPWGG